MTEVELGITALSNCHSKKMLKSCCVREEVTVIQYYCCLCNSQMYLDYKYRRRKLLDKHLGIVGFSNSLQISERLPV